MSYMGGYLGESVGEYLGPLAGESEGGGSEGGSCFPTDFTCVDSGLPIFVHSGDCIEQIIYEEPS